MWRRAGKREDFALMDDPTDAVSMPSNPGSSESYSQYLCDKGKLQCDTRAGQTLIMFRPGTPSSKLDRQLLPALQLLHA